jgi:uncharacterized protein YodC (DUF2158 family)
MLTSQFSAGQRVVHVNGPVMTVVGYYFFRDTMICEWFTRQNKLWRTEFLPEVLKTASAKSGPAKRRLMRVTNR